ncbi:MAG: hypothetical protein JXB26_11825 [Candidatus Aminicenantes bacterium]|nr:hypothetical protein [Candidatus Aminicenantes bacterium]
MRKTALFALVFFLLGKTLPFCCTGFTAFTSLGILVGNNEDYIDSYTDTVVRVRPADGSTYGCLLLGFNQQNFSMGGMNDQGLYFDMFTVPAFAWAPDPNRLDYDGFLEGKMLEECATVQEAVAFLTAYNDPGMGSVYYQIFLVDRSGDAAVVNWWDGDYEVVRKSEIFLVVTNFFLLHPEYGSYPCWRHITASQMLKEAEEYTAELFRTILETVNLTSNYSNICNLTTGDLFVYNRYNFEECIHFNIHQELAKGYFDYQLPDYFSQIHVLAPKEGVMVTNLPLSFEWEGDPDSRYQLFLSTNPNFTDCVPIEVVSRGKRVLNESTAAFIPLVFFAGFLSFAFLGQKRKSGILLLMAAVFLSLFLVSCESSPPPDFDAPHKESLTVNNLQSNTTYYWKIRAFRAGSVFTESIVFTFNTGDVR